MLHVSMDKVSLRQTTPVQFQWCPYTDDIFCTCEKMLQEGHGPDCEGKFTWCKEGMGQTMHICAAGKAREKI